MTVLAVTFDHPTDTLTIAAHGLVTGDGPGALRNVGGALPAALAALTDYWIYRVDANTVKLATSSANALAGVTVAFADNGSGTTYLEVGIPYRRARTYVPNVGGPGTPTPGSQLKSADLNTFMDVLKALHAKFTGQSQTVWSDGEVPILIHPSALRGTNGDYAFVAGGYFLSTGAGSACCAVPLQPGQRIKKVVAEVYGDGAADITQIDIEKWTGGAPTVLGTVAVVNPPAAWADATSTVGAPVAMGTNDTANLRFNYNAANIRIGNIRVYVDRPAA